jgi:hypothetical protein
MVDAMLFANRLREQQQVVFESYSQTMQTIR